MLPLDPGQLSVAGLRLPSIDLLRIVLVAVIVWRHTFPVTIGEHQPLVATVTVTFFFFLTGWLWRPHSRDVRGEVATRWRSLGIPYIAWFVVVYIIAIPIFALRDQLTVRTFLAPFLGGMYIGRPFTTFWFFTALMVVAIGMRMLDRLNRPLLLVVALIALGLGSFFGAQISRIPLAIGSGLVCLGFAIAARLLREAWPDPSRARTVTATIILAAVIPASIPLGWLDIKYGVFGTPYLSSLVAIALTWAAIVLLDALFDVVPTFARAIQPPLSRVASVAIVVVLIHPLALFLLIPPTTSGAQLWVYPCVLVISFTTALLLSRTRARWLFIGGPPPAQQMTRRR